MAIKSLPLQYIFSYDYAVKNNLKFKTSTYILVDCCIECSAGGMPMTCGKNELGALLSSPLFTNILNSSNIKIVEFDALLALLIKGGVPFDVQYTPGTRRIAEAAVLIVYINPTTTLNLTFNFSPGGSIFTGAPGGTSVTP
jgi:hypothetical protein